MTQNRDLHPVTVYLPRDTLETLRWEAKLEDRPVSWLARKVLVNYVATSRTAG